MTWNVRLAEGSDRVLGALERMLRSDTREFEETELTADQAETLKRVVDRIDSFRATLGTPVWPEPEGHTGGRLEDPRAFVLDRVPRVLMLDGPRGTGKTTILVTLLGQWREAQARAKRSEASSAEWATRGDLYLWPLDLHPAPAQLSAYAWLIGAFKRLAGWVAEADPRAGKGPSGAVGLEQEHRQLMHGAIRGWSTTQAQLRTADWMLDVEDQVDHWRELGRSWRLFVDHLVQGAVRAGRLGEKGLIVLAVDDLDLHPTQGEEVLQAVRRLWHPRVVFLLTGNSGHLVDSITLSYAEGIHRRAEREWVFRSIFPDEGREQSRDPRRFARELVTKVVPDAARFVTRGLSLEGVFCAELGRPDLAGRIAELLERVTLRAGDRTIRLRELFTDALGLLPRRARGFLLTFRDLRRFADTLDRHARAIPQDPKDHAARPWLEGLLRDLVHWDQPPGVAGEDAVLTVTFEAEVPPATGWAPRSGEAAAGDALQVAWPHVGSPGADGSLDAASIYRRLAALLAVIAPIPDVSAGVQVGEGAVLVRVVARLGSERFLVAWPTCEEPGFLLRAIRALRGKAPESADLAAERLLEVALPAGSDARAVGVGWEQRIGAPEAPVSEPVLALATGLCKPEVGVSRAFAARLVGALVSRARAPATRDAVARAWERTEGDRPLGLTALGAARPGAVEGALRTTYDPLHPYFLGRAIAQAGAGWWVSYPFRGEGRPTLEAMVSVGAYGESSGRVEVCWSFFADRRRSRPHLVAELVSQCLVPPGADVEQGRLRRFVQLVMSDEGEALDYFRFVTSFTYFLQVLPTLGVEARRLLSLVRTGEESLAALPDVRWAPRWPSTRVTLELEIGEGRFSAPAFVLPADDAGRAEVWNLFLQGLLVQLGALPQAPTPAEETVYATLKGDPIHGPPLPTFLDEVLFREWMEAIVGPESPLADPVLARPEQRVEWWAVAFVYGGLVLAEHGPATLFRSKPAWAAIDFPVSDAWFERELVPLLGSRGSDDQATPLGRWRTTARELLTYAVVAGSPGRKRMLGRLQHPPAR